MRRSSEGMMGADGLKVGGGGRGGGGEKNGVS